MVQIEYHPNVVKTDSLEAIVQFAVEQAEAFCTKIPTISLQSVEVAMHGWGYETTMIRLVIKTPHAFNGETFTVYQEWVHSENDMAQLPLSKHMLMQHFADLWEQFQTILAHAKLLKGKTDAVHIR